jgi:hypothetical protein
MHFVKNLGLLGGLILAAVDTEGEPSLSWRAKRSVRALDLGCGLRHIGSSTDIGSASKAVIAAVPAVAGAAVKGGTRAARRAQRTSRRTGHQTKETALDVAQKAADAREGLSDLTGAVAETARDSGGSAGHVSQQTGAALASAACQLEPIAERAVRTAKTLAQADARLPPRE